MLENEDTYIRVVHDVEVQFTVDNPRKNVVAEKIHKFCQFILHLNHSILIINPI